jgi:hypothetical protein
VVRHLALLKIGGNLRAFLGAFERDILSFYS